jgi:hypothetical protein
MPPVEKRGADAILPIALQRTSNSGMRSDTLCSLDTQKQLRWDETTDERFRSLTLVW